MREIRATSRFHKRLKEFLRKHPEFENVVETTINNIAIGKNAGLRIHPLSGSQKGFHSARISNSYRIVFALEPRIVTFLDIGTHDEVY